MGSGDMGGWVVGIWEGGSGDMGGWVVGIWEGG